MESLILKRRILICIGCILLYVTGNSQTEDSTYQYLTKFEWVAFKKQDSLHQYTRFIEPNGSFYFQQGHLDSCFSDNGIQYLVNQRKVSDIQSLEFEFLTETIDTIESYFPTNLVETQKLDSFGENFDIVYSYVLNQMGESNTLRTGQNTIRLIYPCEPLNSCNYYNLYTIIFHEKSATMFFSSGISIDYKGMQIARKDSIILMGHEFRKLQVELNNNMILESAACFGDGNPWILELSSNNSHKYFIVSQFCSLDKKLRGISKLYHTVLKIAYRHHIYNCNNDLTIPYEPISQKYFIGD